MNALNLHARSPDHRWRRPLRPTAVAVATAGLALLQSPSTARQQNSISAPQAMATTAPLPAPIPAPVPDPVPALATVTVRHSAGRRAHLGY